MVAAGALVRWWKSVRFPAITSTSPSMPISCSTIWTSCRAGRNASRPCRSTGHGANWTYVIWGALHGSYLILGHFAKKIFSHYLYPDEYLSKFRLFLVNARKIFITFNLVALSWIFFRAKDVNDAIYIIFKIITFQDYDSNIPLTLFRENEFSSLMVTIGLLVLFLLSDSFMDKLVKQQKFLPNRKWTFTLFASILVVLLIFGHFSVVTNKRSFNPNEMIFGTNEGYVYAASKY